LRRKFPKRYKQLLLALGFTHIFRPASLHLSIFAPPPLLTCCGRERGRRSRRKRREDTKEEVAVNEVVVMGGRGEVSVIGTLEWWKR